MEADKLADPEIFVDVGYFKILPYISGFKAFDKIAKCCFTTKTVGADLNNIIKEFRAAFLATEVGLCFLN